MKSNASIIISIFLAGLIIGGAVFLTRDNSGTAGSLDENANNVSIVNGKQIIEIQAKGGYHPVHSLAKAGIPTILRMNTNGTFDCTAVVRLPSLDISQNLPMSGSTDIDLGTQKITTIQGTCGMGMYPFDIKFE